MLAIGIDTRLIKKTILLNDLITIMKKFVFRAFFILCHRLGLYSILADVSVRFVKPIGRNNHQAKHTILVTDYERFRGDVDIFSRHPDFQFLSISPTFLLYLLAVFVREPIQQEWIDSTHFFGVRGEFAAERPGSKIAKQREVYRIFLERFLPEFFRRLSVNMIVNSDARYRREADFIRVATQVGVPQVCYYREALYIVPAHFKHAVDRHRILGPFYSRFIAVQNAVARKTFVDAEICPPENIIIRGCPRMDDFIGKVNSREMKECSSKGKQVTFFSCPRGAQLKDLSYFSFFEASLAVMRAFARLAVVHPDIHFVIKMKDMHLKGPNNGQMGSYISEIEKSAQQPINRISNIEFCTERMAAQETILNSHVVCGMQSTTILEAAIAGKPIILPHIKEIREKERVEEVLMFREYYHLFDIPDVDIDIDTLILARLENPVVTESVMNERRKVFEEFVSPFTGDATARSLEIFRKALQ